MAHLDHNDYVEVTPQVSWILYIRRRGKPPLIVDAPTLDDDRFSDDRPA
jgi:hypothetical protein